MTYANQYLNHWDKLFEGFIPRTEWQPLFTAEENESQFQIQVEMAGVPRDHVKLETVEGRIHISGEHKRYGSFQRSFALPQSSDTQKIEATYDDGVLKIIIPKLEAAKPRQIKIESASTKAEARLIEKEQTM